MGYDNNNIIDNLLQNNTKPPISFEAENIVSNTFLWASLHIKVQIHIHKNITFSKFKLNFKKYSSF